MGEDGENCGGSNWITDCFNRDFIIAFVIIACVGTLILIILSVYWKKVSMNSKSNFEMKSNPSYKNFTGKSSEDLSCAVTAPPPYEKHYSKTPKSTNKTSSNIELPEETYANVPSNSEIPVISEEDEETAPDYYNTAKEKEDEYGFYITNDCYESSDPQNKNDDDEYSFYITNPEYESSNPQK